ncbi:hypothetical protein ACFPRL_35600 [Pseudoclavibacter helvolus]
MLCVPVRTRERDEARSPPQRPGIAFARACAASTASTVAAQRVRKPSSVPSPVDGFAAT